VLDEFGRLAAKKLAPLGIEEAWSQLAGFPMPPDEDDLPDDEEQDRRGKAAISTQSSWTGKGNYPIRKMMQLIENIAMKQTSIDAQDWTAWCIRLEQTLTQAAGSELLEEFRVFDLNPLSPLWHAPFRPEFVELNENAVLRRYQEVLRRIETAWKVSDLGKIGGRCETAV
jgi:hypothetical protein